MPAARRLSYATKAKVEHAIRMAELAGIKQIGSLELAPDGTIRVTAESAVVRAPVSAENEIAEWRERKGKR